MTAMGVSYRLLSMFMLSPDIDDRRSTITLLAGAAAIGIAIVGGLAAIAFGTGPEVVLPIGHRARPCRARAVRARCSRAL